MIEWSPGWVDESLLNCASTARVEWQDGVSSCVLHLALNILFFFEFLVSFRVLHLIPFFIFLISCVSLCSALFCTAYIQSLNSFYNFLLLVHYEMLLSWCHCAFLGQVLVGDDGKSRVYRCTMKQNQKDCAMLFEESEYKHVVLEAYWQSRSKVKMPNNRYHFHCIHCKASHKDMNTISYHRMSNLYKV